MLSKALRLAERVAQFAIWAGGAMMLFAACMVTVDVLLRRFFGRTVGGADEISGYLFAIATSWALAYVLLHRGNVRIDALYLLLPRRVCAFLDLLALLVLGAFMVVLAHHAIELLMTTIHLGARSTTPLRVPLIWPQGFWFAGLVLFLIAYALVLVTTVAALIRGEYEGVRRVAGAPSLDEEIKEELGPDSEQVAVRREV